MSTTSPLRIHADLPPVVFDVPAGTDLLTVLHPAAPLGRFHQGRCASPPHPTWDPPISAGDRRRKSGKSTGTQNCGDCGI